MRPRRVSSSTDIRRAPGGPGCLVAGIARAQSISGLTQSNASSLNELQASGTTTFERQTATSILISSPTGFSTRLTALVSADTASNTAARTEAEVVDYTISFNVTAPGAYRLAINDQLIGDLHIVDDGTNGTAMADVTAVTGISNGVAQAHTLHFQFTLTATSPGGSSVTTGGDQAAVRLGGTSQVPSETAADYPGSPTRIQLNDGHFVNLTLSSLCGNGLIDSGPSYAEQCDKGAANGSSGSCCTATASATRATRAPTWFRSSGSSARPSSRSSSSSRRPGTTGCA